jgi:magnesium chelatase family protein
LPTAGSDQTDATSNFGKFQSEWERRALEVLREPLESGVVTVSRAARSAEFPARFQLVAAKPRPGTLTYVECVS